jgi:hypothetical protein
LNTGERSRIAVAILALTRTAKRTTLAGERASNTVYATIARELAQVGHIFAFTNSEHRALFVGWGGMDIGGAIGLNANTLTKLEAHLFKSLGEQVRYIMAHEIGHNLDLGPKGEASLSDGTGFKMSDAGAVGKLAKEMEAAAQDSNNPFSALLRHTPFKAAYAGRPEAAQLELFAQAFAMYAERNDEMKQHLPQTYARMAAYMEDQHGRSNPVQHSAETNTPATEAVGSVVEAVQEGNNPGASGSPGVQGTRTVGAKPDAATAEGRKGATLDKARGAWLVANIKTKEGLAKIVSAIDSASREKLQALQGTLYEAYPVNGNSDFWNANGRPRDEHFELLQKRVDMLLEKVNAALGPTKGARLD